MERRAEIVLEGRVQKAGYRDYIDEVAFGLDIKGWVKNLEDGTVKVVCEGRSEDIEEFINKIKIHEYPIRVDDAIVEYSPATGEFKDFTIIREEDIVFATYERMDAAGRYMREMNKNLGGKLGKMLEKQDRMLEKQDRMLEKQDRMLEKQDRMLEKQDLQMEITRNGFNDMRKGFADLKEEMRTGFADVKEEIHMQRDDFREVFMHELSELRGEIAEIKTTLARMQGMQA
jgi:acylphosphatase